MSSELVGGRSSSKNKQTRKRSLDAIRKPMPSKKRKVSSKEPESETDEGDDLYPLEGKYLDEEDREMYVDHVSALLR
jgi:hypothetical protein